MTIFPAARKLAASATIVLHCLVAANAAAEERIWAWSPPAAYHEAVVTIRADDGSRTSGGYIEYGQLRGVLTCQHGLGSPEVSVTFSDGTEQRGVCTQDKFKHDLGFVYVHHATLEPLRIASQAVLAGDKVEYLTMGGPQDSRRHFYGRVSRTITSRTEFATPVMNGDSGGMIMNTVGEVVSVQSYGDTKLDTVSDGINLYRGSGGASLTTIRDFLGRVEENSQCGPGGCRPRWIGGGQLGGGGAARGGNYELYPPASRQNGMINIERASPVDMSLYARQQQVDAIAQQVELIAGEVSKLAGVAANAQEGAAVVAADIEQQQGKLASIADTIRDHKAEIAAVGKLAIDVKAEAEASDQSILATLKHKAVDNAPGIGMTIGQTLLGSTPIGLGLLAAGWLLRRRLGKA